MSALLASGLGRSLAGRRFPLGAGLRLLRTRRREPDGELPTGRAQQQPPREDRPRPRPGDAAREAGDLALGLAVRRHAVGYALLRFWDLEPLQFGLVDLEHSLEVQQKALQVEAVLRDLRKTGPEKLQRMAADEAEVRPNNRWRWHVSLDDSALDRAPPSSAKASAAQRGLATLQGLVIGDCKRVFKVAPLLAHPRRSRLLLGIQGNGPEARKELQALAREKVPDFPEVNKRNGGLSEDTYLMSDAWASARLCQREALLALKKSDGVLVEELRRRALATKRLQKMQEAIRELHPRKAGAELQQVLESRVAKMVDDGIHRLLERELAAAMADGDEELKGSDAGERSSASRADEIMEAELARFGGG